MNKPLSILLIAFALVIAIVPLFTDCQSQGRALTLENGKLVPMKCHWTAIAEIGVAVPLLLSGVFNLRSRRKETTRYLAVMGIASGALAILFPTYLIGVCADPMMLCNMIMRPTLITAGLLAVVASAVILYQARQPDVEARLAV
jgi:hypothetical protein